MNKKKYIIKHTRGNYIQFKVPLTVRTTITDYRGVNSTDKEIDLNSPVIVELQAGTRCVRYTATIVDSVAVVEDNGTLPVGVYNIWVKWRDAYSRPMSYMKRTILEVVEASEAGGKYDTDEFDVIAYYPVIKGMRSAVELGENDVSIVEGKYFGEDDTPDDEYADINATLGGGSVEIDEDFVTLNI